ncbi:MAG: protein kinase [Acidobacteriota bacterium]
MNEMINKTVSHYKILEKLGEGGMGEVYLAEDTKLKRKVALKFLPGEFTNVGANGDSPVERFHREAQAAATLNHPNIVTIYEINEHEDQTYIAMEYVDGQTLKELVAGDWGPSDSQLPIAEVINYAIQICEGLKCAHEAGIVHRDIKPQNIIINKEGQVKILDFGLAKLKGVSQLTKESSTLGTIHYMSPEQAMGKDVDHRTDIWSLGVILYEMLTGELPFKGDYDQAVIYSILNEEPEPVAEIRSGLPGELERIIKKALVKDPSKRYQHPDDLLVDLKNIKKGSKTDLTEIKKKFSVRKIQKSRRINFAMILLLSLIIIVGGYFIFTGKREGVTTEKYINGTKWKNSIAVLPFVDMSSGNDHEYFCDGMTEDIITKLTRINKLKVISRTSVMRYKNTKKDIRKIGKELDVKTILEGSVRKEKERIRVTAQLINIKDGSHLWAETFDRKLENIFDLQDEVSKSIAEALELQFRPGTSSVDKPKNFSAYDYLLKMRHWTNIYVISESEDDFRKVLEYAEKALEVDPDYVNIYASLAYAYETHYVNTNLLKDRELVIKNCLIAYRLDPNLSETNVAIGYVYFQQGQHEKTAFHFKKAISLDPNSPEIQHVVGIVLYNSGLYKKAIKYFKKAMELNPFFVYSPLMIGRSYGNLGETDKALLYYNKTLSLAPANLDYQALRINILIMNKRYEEAEGCLKEAEKTEPENSLIRTSKAFLFAAEGKKKEALSIKKISKWRKAQLYSLLGMMDEAFKMIDEDSESSYIRLLKYPFYKNFRRDPRYQKILDKLKEKYDKFFKIFKDF